MRNFDEEFTRRVAFIREQLAASGAAGIVFGNSGGKDSALVGILCKAATENTVGILMPCSSRRNFGMDLEDGRAVAAQFGIESRVLDLTPQKDLAMAALGGITALNDTAISNLAPRLRMLSLYAIAAAENRLVAGTGNRSERHMGYFTKWGDGACDFNPIADLGATEIFDFLRHLGAPAAVIDKAPSAGLWDAQTDEDEMGVSYADIDRFLSGEPIGAEAEAIILRYHERSEHKRVGATLYAEPADRKD